MLDACDQRGASLVIGGVFNSGILATGPKPGAMFNYAPASQEFLDRVTKLQQVCEANGVALPAAALQFPLRHEAVASVLLGVSNAQNLGRNLEGLAAGIPQALWTDLAARGLLNQSA